MRREQKRWRGERESGKRGTHIGGIADCVSGFDLLKNIQSPRSCVWICFILSEVLLPPSPSRAAHCKYRSFLPIDHLR